MGRKNEIKATKGNITIRINPAESYMKVLNRGKTTAESAENPAESADYPAESADYPAESADYPADMKPRYKQILEAMLKDVWYSTEQIGEMVSLKGSRTRELMKELVDLGYVEITAGTKGRRYKKK